MIGDIRLTRGIVACRDRLKAPDASAAGLLCWSVAELTLMAWLERRWRRVVEARVVVDVGDDLVVVVLKRVGGPEIVLEGSNGADAAALAGFEP